MLHVSKPIVKSNLNLIFSLILLFPAFSFAQTIAVTDSLNSFFKGNFKDDYGIRYSIKDTLWLQQPNAKYHVLSWNSTEQYIILHNDSKNPSEANLYTRIDYMLFKNMEPYQWGFCYTVYSAKSAKEAEQSAKADRGNPKKGCGGFPFTRMARVE